MKKLLYCVAALAGLFLAASCQQENLEPVAGNGTVTFTVEAPANVQTRAIADGQNVDQLVYEVWLTPTIGTLDGGQKLYQAETKMVSDGTVNKATLTLDLVNDQKFTVLFWAQVQGTGVYDTQELTAVHYTSTAAKAYAANDERLAAFYAVAYVSDCRHVEKDGTTPTGSEVTLRRPFAQLNLGTLNTSTAYDVELVSSKVKVTNANTKFNVATSVASEPKVIEFLEYNVPSNPSTLEVNGVNYEYAGMNYLFAGDNATVEYDITTKITGVGGSEMSGNVNNIVSSVPLKENYRTNIIGNLLTSKVDYEIVVDAEFNKPDVELGEIEGQTYTKVTNTAEFTDAFNNNDNDIIILGNDINLNDLTTRSTEANPTYVIGKGKTLTIDLNGFTLSSTSSQTGKNYNMLDVNGGTLTVKNGAISYEHKGENMLWNNSTNIFNVTNGGVLNLEGVTAKNLGGSDMGFVAHLNNWGEVTLNAENCTLESNYVAVRVFNSGPDMNNVDIKNSTLKGGSYAFWVHNYTVEDFGTAEKAAAQQALLNVNIYNQGNDLIGGVRYGMTNKVVADGNGITCNVSEDGSVVTLNTMSENGVVARYAAGAEENSTVTKVVVGEGISVLEDRTFRKYYALETVELPSTLTALGVAGEQYTSGNVFQGCAKLTNITIPESVTTLGMGTFYGCKSLTSINVPAGVTRIEKDTFRETGLTSIEFHEGVTYFGDYAFRDCEDLTEVIIKAPKFEVGSSTFLNAAGAVPSLTIYVANSEMKEYLEPKISANKQFKVVVPGLVSTADELTAALADETKDVITLAAGVTFEGTFTPKRNVKIVSENVADGRKAIIKGRVNIDNYADGIRFENVKFEINDASKVRPPFQGTNYKYPGIVMMYATAATFEGCEFACEIASGVCGINYGAYAPGKLLKVNNCKFTGDFYAIRTRTLFEITNNEFNVHTDQGILAAVWTWGNGEAGTLNNSGADVVTFTGNTNVNTNKVYGVQLTSTTYNYCELKINVQGNTNFYELSNSVNPSCVFTGSTFAEGSETFEF